MLERLIFNKECLKGEEDDRHAGLLRDVLFVGEVQHGIWSWRKGKSFGFAIFLSYVFPTGDERISYDPAYWFDWIEILKELGATESINRKNLLQAI